MPDIVAAAVGIGFVVLWLYCLYDVITTDEAIIQHLPKVVWVLIVFLLFDIGSILWLAIGRPRVWTKRAHDPERYGRSQPVPRQTVGQLDDPKLDHLSPLVRHREEQARLHMWEAQLKRREDELRRKLSD